MRNRTNGNRIRHFVNTMNRTNALPNNALPNNALPNNVTRNNTRPTMPMIRRTSPPPPAYYEEPPPTYQPPAPKPKLLKRIKNMFKKTKKTSVRTPPPVYSSPLPQQQPRTYGENLPTYQPGGNKSRRRRKSKKRISHKRS
jgi:hypothetical protein